MPSIARGRTSAGGITVVKPAAAGLVHRHVDQRQLEVGPGAGEVVEPGAGDLRAAVDVDRAEHPAELDVVARLEPLGGEVARLPDVLEHDEVVLAAGRGLLGRRVRDASGRPAGTPPRPRPGRPRPPSPRRPASLVRARSCLLLLALGPRRSACRGSSARSGAARTPRSPPAAARRPRAPRRRRPPTARDAPGRRGHGRGRLGGRGDRSPAHAIDRVPPLMLGHGVARRRGAGDDILVRPASYAPP